ncbi:hypothetical protein H310_07285 [Aphanomyces invadans]|uniref:Uncharacterized protein n=1 Tax=Aphanomyces invadans TaxID=157072 RepID=A0A024U2S7_9STRA|nr:hypothetical protein H310_07285 [Aphanomyces invadans]ETW00736.1 hypothetical protein H310_07285 [Aphanomyces invadans]|eukprot:XP_008870871.1 hypothetical protein H310_07285 [Aphanomyces invadans]
MQGTSGTTQVDHGHRHRPSSRQRPRPEAGVSRLRRLPSPKVKQGKAVVLEPLAMAVDPPAPPDILPAASKSPYRLSMQNDQRQDAEFAHLVQLAQATLRSQDDAVDAAAAVAATLAHVEQRHYASLTLRKQHVHILQQLELELEALERTMGSSRQQFRSIGNQHLHVIAEQLLHHTQPSLTSSRTVLDESSVAMHLREAGAAYKKAGDQRHECMPVLTHKAHADRCYQESIALVRRGDDLDAAVERMADAATAYALYRQSPLFDQCQLVLSVAAADVAWSHNALSDATDSLDERIKSAHPDCVVGEARACMLEALETAKHGIVANGGQYDSTLLQHVRRCNQYMAWLGRHSPAILAATGVTPAVTSMLEKKVHKASIAHSCRALPTRTEYELDQLIGHWIALAKADVDLATVLVTESALQQAAAAALHAAQDTHFPALLVLSDTLIAALGASMPAAFTSSWLQLLCQMTTASMSNVAIIPTLLRHLKQLLTSKQLVHVVTKAGFVALVQVLRDGMLGHQDIMRSVVEVVAACIALHPKCFNDEAHHRIVVPCFCAVLLRYAKTPPLVAEAIPVLISLFANSNLPASKAADCQLVSAFVPALASCGPPLRSSALQLFRDLASADKRVLAQCRQHRTVLLAAFSQLPPDDPMLDFADQLKA